MLAKPGGIPLPIRCQMLPKKTCILVLYCAFTCNNKRTKEKAVEPLFMRISLILKGSAGRDSQPGNIAFSLRW